MDPFNSLVIHFLFFYNFNWNYMVTVPPEMSIQKMEGHLLKIWGEQLSKLIGQLSQ